MKKRRRAPCHQGQDQYGDTGASQDRDEALGGASGSSMRGGGSAGGRQSARGEVIYERHIPKFLQEHMHHLEPRQKRQTEETVFDEEQDRIQDEQVSIRMPFCQSPIKRAFCRRP